MLARVSLERARAIAPFVLLALVGSLVASEPTGVPLHVPVVAWNLVAISVMAVGGLALWRRRIPVRYGHVALAAQWWFAVGGTLLSHYYTGEVASLVPLIFIEISALALLLHTPTLIASLVLLAALWIPIILRDLGGDASIYLSALFLSQAFAIVFHRVLRGALLRAEVAAAELTHQLEERNRLQEQLMHSQRMEASGTLAAGLAHDMNNILASITSYAELLRTEVDRSAHGDLESILAQATRGAELTRGLLAFSRRGQYRRRVIEIDGLLRDLVPLLARTLPKGIEIHTALAGRNAHVAGDPPQLQQVIVNLGVNAADAMDGKGRLEITSQRVLLDASAAAQHHVHPGAYVRVLVTDTGRGMDEETRRRVFEPFFTTKPMGKGTGLGLSMVWGIVQSHGGAIDVASEIGAGTTFTVYLPVTTERPQPESVPPPVTEGPKKTTVLVVDDEDAVRRSTMRLLERRGHETLGACNGEDALRVLAEHRDEIGLVILDMGMPQMGGAECFAHIRKTSQVPVLIATGYAIAAEAQALVAEGASLIEKPFPSSLLTREVARILAAS